MFSDSIAPQCFSVVSMTVQTGLTHVQQIGDDQRGWAWTRALQGVPANEIHLCGDGSALPLIRRLAAAMNEPLEVRFARLRDHTSTQKQVRWSARVLAETRHLNAQSCLRHAVSHLHCSSAL